MPETMTIQELLFKCDYSEIAKIYCGSHVKDGHPADKNTTEMLFRQFGLMLSSLKANPSEDVFIGYRIYDDGSPYISAELFEMDEVQNSLRNLPSYYPKMPKYMSDREFWAYLHRSFDFFPLSYGYRTLNWEDVLGAKVYPCNIRQVGLQPFMYSFLIRMSSYGFDRKLRDGNISKLQMNLQGPEEYYSGGFSQNKSKEKTVPPKRSSKTPDWFMRMIQDVADTYRSKYEALKLIFDTSPQRLVDFNCMISH